MAKKKRKSGKKGKKKSRKSKSKGKSKKRKSKKSKKGKKSKRQGVERVATGIEGLDKLAGGGFEKNSVNLIVGDSGSGKTIFAMQYLMEGLKEGENCLFITFEEDKEEFYDNMSEFGWDLKKYEDKDQFHFLEYSPEKVQSMIEQGGGEIENIVINNSVTRIVVDSITSFALLFEDELKKREAALSLFSIVRKWDTTSLLTLQENPSEREAEKSSPIEFESDGIILLYFVREKKKRKRFIEILKMRATDHSTEIHEMKLDSKSGFKVTGKTHSDGFD